MQYNKTTRFSLLFQEMALMFIKILKTLSVVVFITLVACGQPGPEPTEVLIVEAMVSPTPPETQVLEMGEAPLPTAVATTLEPEVGNLETPGLTLEEMTQDAWFVVSPNADWTIEVQVAYPLAEDGSSIGEDYYVRLSVFRQDGSLRWEILDEWRPFGLGYTLPSQFHWSDDENFLFFTEHGIQDGCPTVFGFDCGLYRFDLESGSLANLATGRCGAARASHDGSLFAVLQNETIFISNDEAGFTREWNYTEAAGLGEQGSWQAGGVVWSPDGSALVFTVLHDISCDDGITSSSILMVDLDSGAIEVLVDKDAHEYLTADWSQKDNIELFDASGIRYWLNIEDKTITPVD
jgi:hypothetical protein